MFLNKEFSVKITIIENFKEHCRFRSPRRLKNIIIYEYSHVYNFILRHASAAGA